MGHNVKFEELYALTREAQLKTLQSILTVIPEELRDKLPQEQFPQQTELNGEPADLHLMVALIREGYKQRYGFRRHEELRKEYADMARSKGVQVPETTPHLDYQYLDQKTLGEFYYVGQFWDTDAKG